jgi:hypothetical protein
MRWSGVPSRAAVSLLIAFFSLTLATLAARPAAAQPYGSYDPGYDPSYAGDAGAFPEPGYQQYGAYPDGSYGGADDPYGSQQPYDAYGAQPAFDPGVSPEYFAQLLAPFGQWIQHPRWGEVWQVNAGPGFRPYLNGQWELTQEFGWLWVSADPWGEVTDHYGRWVFDPDAGWLWVPGYVWAPSWVIWREGGGFIGWFPMPPGYDEFDPQFATYAGGSYRDPNLWYGYRNWYPQMADTSFLSLWVFVGSQDFGRPGFRRYIRDGHRARDFWARSHDRTRYVNLRNRVVDRSIDVDWLRQATRRQFAAQPAQRFLRGRQTSITEGREIWRRARSTPRGNFTGNGGRGPWGGAARGGRVGERPEGLPNGRGGFARGPNAGGNANVDRARLQQDMRQRALREQRAAGTEAEQRALIERRRNFPGQEAGQGRPARDEIQQRRIFEEQETAQRQQRERLELQRQQTQQRQLQQQEQQQMRAQRAAQQEQMRARRETAQQERRQQLERQRQEAQQQQMRAQREAQQEQMRARRDTMQQERQQQLQRQRQEAQQRQFQAQREAQQQQMRGQQEQMRARRETMQQERRQQQATQRQAVQQRQLQEQRETQQQQMRAQRAAQQEEMRARRENAQQQRQQQMQQRRQQVQERAQQTRFENAPANAPARAERRERNAEAAPPRGARGRGRQQN